MRIAYYMPLKPPGHANPSGDLVTGRELREFLVTQDHQVELASSLRSRWIYWKPHNLLRLRPEKKRICRRLQKDPVQLWLTYHTYYKAPDLLGGPCCKALDIPYVIFQGIYSTKRRRKLKSLPGFILNRSALMAAQMVYTNKRKDEKNLHRLLPQERVSYLAPGIQPGLFGFDAELRKEVRAHWQVGDRKVVLSTAMLRPGVKTAGIQQVIRSCASLIHGGHKILLVIIGDGRNRQLLESEAGERLGDACVFAGRIDRLELYRYYSGADLFAFPGIEESLGMVYLEAQSTGLPVVAFSDWGASEAVVDQQTGLLTPAARPEEFTAAIERLLTDKELREDMGQAGRTHVRANHNLTKNYQRLTEHLQEVVAHYRRRPEVPS